VVFNKATEIGLTNDTQFKYPIVIKHGTNDMGKTIRYYLNYSANERTAVYNFTKGIDLFTGKVINKGDNIILKPWDLVIVEE
jgi:beta-galactosidase